MENTSNNLFKNITRVKIMQLDGLIIWFLPSAHFSIFKKQQNWRLFEIAGKLNVSALSGFYIIWFHTPWNQKIYLHLLCSIR